LVGEALPSSNESGNGFSAEKRKNIQTLFLSRDWQEKGRRRSFEREDWGIESAVIMSLKGHYGQLVMSNPASGMPIDEVKFAV